MDQPRLEDVARAFGRWRASKESPSQRIPELLWARAVAAARVHGSTRTARTLRLNPSVLKRRLEQEESSSAREFVELPLGLLATRESVLELEDVTGVRLRVVFPNARPHEVAAAARELWSARP
jgi:hypothetical protein